jgi:hypothetical protein
MRHVGVPGDDEAARWERRAIVLGAGRLTAADEIAALEEAGWAFEGATTPHYGTLILIGHFRRAPAATGDDRAPGPGGA